MPLWPSVMSCLLFGRRRWCQTTSAMLWSSPTIRKREVSQTAGTTGAFPSSQLRERSLRMSSLTDSEQILPVAQCGFRPGRITVNMIFTVRQLQEKCNEQNKPLYLIFIDLTKAFDTVNREALWTVLQRIGCPPKLVSMIRLFHDGITGQVLSNGNVTDAFVISNGVNQGCVLAPVLFNVFFTCMLSHAIHYLEKGIYIQYRLDGSLFDLHRLTGKSKSQQNLLQEVLFGDDCAQVAHAEQDLQRMLNRFSEVSKSSAWQSVSERRRCSTDLHYTPTPPPPSPLMTNHMPM